MVETIFTMNSTPVIIGGKYFFKIGTNGYLNNLTPFDEYIIVDQELNVLFTNPDYTSFVNQLDCVKISGNQLTIKNPVIKQQLLSMIESNRKTESIHNQCHSCQITLVPISSLENLYKWEYYKDGFILTFTHDKDKNALEIAEEIYDPFIDFCTCI